jgi:hypothetical protein
VTPSDDREPGAGERRKTLPKRDLVILPLLVVVTILAIAVPLELLVRQAFPSKDVDECLAVKEAHGRPNCVSRTKAPEGPWAEMKYNECGYRTAESCRIKPPGALRIVVLGSSTSSGHLTPYENTMAARAARELTRQCGRPVEVQNLGALGNRGDKLVASAREALTLKPDAAVLVVTQTDLELIRDDTNVADGDPPPVPEPNVIRRIKSEILQSRLLYMESYLLLREDENYVPVFLKSGHKADFMRAPLPKPWAYRVSTFEATLRQVSDVMRGSDVPLLLLFVPQRAQAAIAAAPAGRPNVDPFLLPRELQQASARAGVPFVDSLSVFPKNVPSEKLFYAINGHINGKGHAFLAQALLKGLEHPNFERFREACVSGGQADGDVSVAAHAG